MAYFHKAPLIYFHGVVPSKYLAVWPVFIVADDPQKLTFKIAVDDLSLLRT
jgi:putative restriction endonuclease